MKYENEMTLIIQATSQNESFARSAVAAFFAQLNPSVEQVEDLKTAVSEAVTNCVVHAYPDKQGKIELHVGLCDGAVYVDVKDSGVGIEDVDKAMQPFYTTGEERSGMGFTVMQAFCDSLAVRSDKHGTCVSMMKKVSERSAK